MSGEIYDQLADFYNKIGFEPKKCPELIALLKYLFNQEEARVILNLSTTDTELSAKVADKICEDKERIAILLENMAKRGLIYSETRNDEKRYRVLRLIPGIFEVQFMKGEVSDWAKDLARLFEDYINSREEAQRQIEINQDGGIHYSRVIPIEETIGSPVTILPFENVRKYIENAKQIALGTCYCRHKKRLLDVGCNNPVETCLQLGPFSKYIIERGFGRAISKQEALEVLKKSADAGLVHFTSNTKDKVEFICNCCSCCCQILRGVRSLDKPVRGLSSNYQGKVNADLCNGCGVCVEKCPMEAVNLTEDSGVHVSADRCIGCGVCVYHCPVGAMTLASRNDFIEPFNNFKELMEKRQEAQNKSL